MTAEEFGADICSRCWWAFVSVGPCPHWSEAMAAAMREATFKFACSAHGADPPKSFYCSTCGRPMSGPASVKGKIETLLDLLEFAWGIIANAGGGDWTTQHPEWQEAAARWRDRYHAVIAAKWKDPEP